MSLAADIVENLEGFSKALYSTWFFYRPARALFDCGEGVATTLGNRVFGVESVFLSHGHYDHIGGLPGFVLTRNAAMGDTQKPLAVHYPRGDAMVESLRRYVDRGFGHVRFCLDWRPFEPGERIPVRSGAGVKHIVPFPTRHVRHLPSHGYALVESRRRLRAEFRDLPGERVGELVREQGGDALMESYEQRLLVYSGDAVDIPAADVAGAEVLIHEATFLKAKHREEHIHSTAEEAVRLGIEAGVQTLVLSHLSGRYDTDDPVALILAVLRRLDPAFPVYLARHRSARDLALRRLYPAEVADVAGRPLPAGMTPVSQS